MLRVGITGGIGSGKTALTDRLATQGIVIVDADLAARVVVEPGQPALIEIAETFGEEYLLPDGQLDRAALRQRVFADESQRKALEAITHPRIRDELASKMSEATSSARSPQTPRRRGTRRPTSSATRRSRAAPTRFARAYGSSRTTARPGRPSQ